MSQPALHVQVGKLADAVGRPLYTRSGRVIALTAIGERVARYARDLARREAELLAELSERPGPVTLAAGTGALLYLIGDGIRRFDPSKRQLRILSLSGADAIAAVSDGRADLAVATARVRALRSIALGKVGSVVAMPSAHRLADRKRLTARDLEGEAMIVPAEGSPHRARVAAAFEGAGIELSISLEASGWEVMLQLVRLRLGLAVVNDFCRMPPSTAAVEFRGLDPIEYRLLWRGELSAAATRLRDALAR